MQPYAFSAVMHEAITEYGPASPRARYQWCMSLSIEVLPQLWSW